MATMKRSRTEYASLSQYSEGRNPYFTKDLNNLFVSDPRLDLPTVTVTKTRNDQILFDDAYHSENIHGLNERFSLNPDAFKMEYKSINGPIVQSIVSMQEKGKRISLVAPLSKVMVSNVTGNVCCTIEQEMKEVPVNPTDYETLINKTEWKLILSESSYESKETDGDDANEFNISFIEFTTAIRKFEEAFIKDIARRMIESFDKTTNKPKFLPELAFNKELRTAIKNGNAEGLAAEIIRSCFVSVYRQAKLTDDEIQKVSELYSAEHGQLPSEDYLAQNITAVYSSGKLTMSTKQFQRSMDKGARPIDMKFYTQHAKEICEANPGIKWCPFSIHKTSGNGIIPFNENFKISRGDIVAPFFTPSFVVYKINGDTKCGLKLQLNQKILYHKKAPEYVGGSNFSAKKLKFSVEDDQVFPSTGEAHAIPESVDNFGDEY